MATECWLGLFMGSDGSSTLWERAEAPHFGSRALAPKTTVVVKPGRVNIEYICM